jgi:hypothetical protein
VFGRDTTIQCPFREGRLGVQRTHEEVQVTDKAFKKEGVPCLQRLVDQIEEILVRLGAKLTKIDCVAHDGEEHHRGQSFALAVLEQALGHCSSLTDQDGKELGRTHFDLLERLGTVLQDVSRAIFDWLESQYEVTNWLVH